MEGYERECIGEVDNAHELLKVVYRSPLIPLAVRLRAAIAAIPFESPKLAVTAVVSENDFATLLDRRLARISEQKQIEAKPTPTNADARLPPPIPDRRFRRI
jgi:hypothetical protein